ncbi:hypothetical protein CKA32_004900 [Geitlerinema sp. FC II]|nr:hypothetical protein CKA32_004900 [Geitlerinema sp. FC II]
MFRSPLSVTSHDVFFDREFPIQLIFIMLIITLFFTKTQRLTALN